jgi:hypothetical protein
MAVNPKSLANLRPFERGNRDGRAGRKAGQQASWTKMSLGMRRQLAAGDGITPVDLFLSLLRDPKTPMGIRLKAAEACAPYIHRRMPVAVEDVTPQKRLVDLDALSRLSPTELEVLSNIAAKLGIGTVDTGRGSTAIGAVVSTQE